VEEKKRRPLSSFDEMYFQTLKGNLLREERFIPCGHTFPSVLAVGKRKKQAEEKKGKARKGKQRFPDHPLSAVSLAKERRSWP
jgi:hypothetical protein